ncbi:GMP synthase [Trichinella spiralis]|uniref:GMP synthase n=1 Tax=Trichinella spiralis TaxID=6334 RepID=A0ABR3KFS9_TRISP
MQASHNQILMCIKVFSICTCRKFFFIKKDCEEVKDILEMNGKLLNSEINCRRLYGPKKNNVKTHSPSSADTLERMFANGYGHMDVFLQGTVFLRSVSSVRRDRGDRAVVFNLSTLRSTSTNVHLVNTGRSLWRLVQPQWQEVKQRRLRCGAGS